MHLAEPAWLWLALLATLPWLWSRVRVRAALRWPTLEGFAKAPKAFAGWPRHIRAFLRSAAVVCLAIAMARPQAVAGRTRVAGKGVAIVVALDQSPSMRAADFASEGDSLTRLEAAKRTFARFVAGRPDDLIGLVTFANFPDLACPPTLDHGFLLEAAARVRPAAPGDEGTNIGDAIVWSIEALKHTTPAKKVLILLTDGENRPAVPRPADPEAVAGLARSLGITLHTIAVGQAGGLVRQVEPETKLDLIGQVGAPDFVLLAQLAEKGGGQAFVAGDAHSLDAVFATINQLEKSPVQAVVHTRYRELFLPWVCLAFSLLMLELILGCSRLSRLP